MQGSSRKNSLEYTPYWVTIKTVGFVVGGVIHTQRVSMFSGTRSKSLILVTDEVIITQKQNAAHFVGHSPAGFRRPFVVSMLSGTHSKSLILVTDEVIITQKQNAAHFVGHSPAGFRRPFVVSMFSGTHSKSLILVTDEIIITQKQNAAHFVGHSPAGFRRPFVVSMFSGTHSKSLILLVGEVIIPSFLNPHMGFKRISLKLKGVHTNCTQKQRPVIRPLFLEKRMKRILLVIIIISLCHPFSIYNLADSIFSGYVTNWIKLDGSAHSYKPVQRG